MRYSFFSKTIDVTENFQGKITKKLNRVAKLFPEDAETVVTLTEIKDKNKVEVTVTLPNKRIVKAEVLDRDIMVALDDVVDILEKQVVKYKNRLNDKAKRSKSFADELNAVATGNEEYESAETSSIVKVKNIPVKPMDPEEAVMQMEMIGHSFFVFINSDTNQVNVVYKRNDGAYALIVPES